MLGEIPYPIRPVVIDRETCFFLPHDFLSLYSEPERALTDFMLLDIFSFKQGKYLPQSEKFKETIQFAKNYLKQDKEKLKRLYFHNENHTFHPVKGVLSVALKLAIIDGIAYTDNVYERIGLAAVLHDIGNIVERQEHEQISIDVSRDKLLELGYCEQTIADIACSIYSTAIDYNQGNPRRIIGSREAKIVSDADLSNPGFYDVTNFAIESIKIWMELDKFSIEEYETLGVAFTQDFFTELGGYFTSAAKYLFNQNKQNNLVLLSDEIHRLLQLAEYNEQNLQSIINVVDKEMESLIEI